MTENTKVSGLYTEQELILLKLVHLMHLQKINLQKAWSSETYQKDIKSSVR